ncbi:GTPase required for pre-60S ribosomal subunit nuclear export and maturation [Steccherinum ochraceum]|uniref:Nucleolar GTP-binding protein 2 n=1 Tax=Steccherinum ochraceum TaxID=92696 RepID=A0A4R0RF07_9APHY|nr:GTPase required for pre-60S ribosomal subunit nuclear export and maturation [Steccherinum ochraceum]
MAPATKSPSGGKTRSSSSSDIHLKKVKGENFYRNAKQVGRLKMLNGGKAVRDKDGKIIQAAAFQKGEDETTAGRVQPDRRWFGNTRVISQKALDHFRTSLAGKQHDPYSVLLRRNKLPMALLDDAANPNLRKRTHIVETESFKDTFGPKAQRKKPRLDVGTFEELGQLGSAATQKVADDVDATYTADAIAASSSGLGAEFQTHADYNEPIFAKGTSRRIYGELYKVIDSSDVVLHILDARDPLGTLCDSVLEYIRKEKSHKQVVLVINKCDLVPNWVTARYIQQLTPRYPTIAFHASPNHSFGKGSLIQLLRQFSQLHSDKKQISVGFIGYPNVGKSSVINTLKSGKVCNVAPVPGETKVWQYITLTKRIYLIDCPGIVPASAKDSQTSTVLKGVVRVEALPTPSEHIDALMQRVKPIYLSRTYGVPLPNADDQSQSWPWEDFLDKLARMKGRLLKGGEPDLDGVAKIILSDWVRGRIPFFVPPPDRPEELNQAEAKVKARKAANAKGKAKAEEKEERTLGVKQNLGSIMQKNTFVGDDVRPLEIEGEDVPDVSVDGDEERGEEDEKFEEVQGEEEELSWNDVFQGDAPQGDLTVFSRDEDAEEDEEVEDDDDEAAVSEDENEAESTKEARMKTNKRKAENFYTKANVKNKNRQKAALMKSLQKSGPGRSSRKKT